MNLIAYLAPVWMLVLIVGVGELVALIPNNGFH